MEGLSRNRGLLSRGKVVIKSARIHKGCRTRVYNAKQPHEKVGSHRRRASVIGDILVRPSGAALLGLQGLQLTGRADVGYVASAIAQRVDWTGGLPYCLSAFECNLVCNLN